MAACTSCGSDVTGKKFCQQCGTPVQPTITPVATSQPAPSNVCPRCNGEVKPGAAFLRNCGTPMSAQVQATVVATPHPTARPCAACHTEVPFEHAFCPNCGHNMNAPAAAPTALSAPAFCTSCGTQNAPGVRFCASCGSQIGAAPMPSGQYPAQPQYTAYPPQYGQPQ